MTPDDRELQYRVVDAIVFLAVILVIAFALSGCASPTEPEEPTRPPRPPRPAVCWGNTPGCVSL
jgi:hypothetical protein